ncbi:MAG: hypothetical protein ACLPYS_00530 [Vulcanimicrobiaceae bacterium]
MNDDRRGGQFSLTFDNAGRLTKIGRAAVGTNPSGSPAFTLRTAGELSRQGNMGALLMQRRLAGDNNVGSSLIGDGTLKR